MVEHLYLLHSYVTDSVGYDYASYEIFLTDIKIVYIYFKQVKLDLYLRV